jgi:predicted PurR-regulated permease PerM
MAQISEKMDAPAETLVPPEAEVVVVPRLQLQTVALVGLLVLGVFYTFYFASAVFIPIALAVLFSLLLAPLVRRLARLGIPEALGAALIIALVLAGAAFGILRLAGPATEWLGQAPYSFARLEQRIRDLRGPVEQVQEATRKVEELADMNDGAQRPAVVVEGPGLAQSLALGTYSVLTATAITVVLLYFMLASGDLFLLKLVQVLPRLRDKKLAIEIARRSEREISTYLLTITCVNTVLGLATGIAMHLLAMPNPVLWGVVAAMLNFIPYLGPTMTLAILSFVALLSFDTWGEILLPPLVFLFLTAIEGQLITPLVVGRRLMLNPVVIFIALLVWGWLWGVPGMLMAVPLLAAFKILCDHIDPMRPFGAFLGRREE